eukprot:scaffold13031_cov101-Isochrysis_galbana.AAC.6
MCHCAASRATPTRASVSSRPDPVRASLAWRRAPAARARLRPGWERLVNACSSGAVVRRARRLARHAAAVGRAWELPTRAGSTALPRPRSPRRRNRRRPAQRAPRPEPQAPPGAQSSAATAAGSAGAPTARCLAAAAGPSRARHGAPHPSRRRSRCAWCPEDAAQGRGGRCPGVGVKGGQGSGRGVGRIAVCATAGAPLQPSPRAGGGPRPPNWPRRAAAPSGRASARSAAATAGARAAGAPVPWRRA